MAWTKDSLSSESWSVCEDLGSEPWTACENLTGSPPSIDVFSAAQASCTYLATLTITVSDPDGDITGYFISTSATEPALDDPGWTGVKPTTYDLVSAGSYTLYLWVKDSQNNLTGPSSSAITIAELYASTPWAAFGGDANDSYTYWPKTGTTGTTMLAADSLGRLYFFWLMKEVLVGTDYDRVWFAYSDDDGATWSAPVSISQGANNATRHHYFQPRGNPVYVMSDNTLVVHFLGSDAQSDGSQLAISSDRGSTWSIIEVDAEFTGAGINPDAKSSMCVDGNDKIYVFSSDDNDATKNYVTMSTDKGATWSAPAAVITEATYLITHEGSCIDSNGNVLSFDISPTSPRGADDWMRISRSTDSGATWSEIGGFDLFNSSGTWRNFFSDVNGGLHFAMEGYISGLAKYAVGYIGSSDGGETWGSWTQNMFTNSFADYSPYIFADRCAKLNFLAFSMISGQTSKIQHKTSSDGGTTWDAGETINHSVDFAGGYADFRPGHIHLDELGDKIFVPITEDESGSSTYLKVTYIEY